MYDFREEERRAGYPVSFEKSTEGGPCVVDIKARAKELGVKVEFYPSCYVGQRCIKLKQGTKVVYQKLLKEFGIDYLT